MLRNYLTTALRNLLRQKFFSLINILGLAIGLATSILILLWVQDELRFDAYHANADHLYRVTSTWEINGEKYPVATNPAPLATTLQNDIPEISYATRFAFTGQKLFQYGDQTIGEKDGAYADPAFLQMFTLPLISGDPQTALNNPSSILLSKKLAEKYFGSPAEALGKIIRVDNQYSLAVTGVFNPVPANSHLRFEYLIPFVFQKELGVQLDDNWSDYNYFTYLQLDKQAHTPGVESKVEKVLQATDPETKVRLYLQPLRRIHLHSHFQGDIGGHGDVQYVYIFSAVALFVLLIACINYMNLATARSARRAQEVGLRKVVGASRGQLITQFMGESVLLTGVSLLVSLLLVWLLLPLYNELSGKTFTFGTASAGILLGLFGIILFTGLLAGSYPAFLLSSFQPVKVLKGKTIAGSRSSALLRRGLVTLQFALSIVLIISTLIIYSQMQYIRSKKLGYSSDNVMILNMRGNILRSYESLRSELLQIPGVTAVTSASQDVSEVSSSTSGASWDGKDPDVSVLFNQLSVDRDFIQTFSIPMTEGRAFSRDLATDSAAFIINEAAVKQMGVPNPVGLRFSAHGVTGTIVGVAQNFHFRSLHEKIEPLLMFVSPNWRSQIYLKISSDNIPGTIAATGNVWKKFESAHAFEYRFLDQNFERMYRAERRAGTLFNCFAGIAIFISCLGLFGLAAYTAEQRSREIAIRKVLGASQWNLIALLSREFTRLVLLAFIIAVPVAWIIMHQWLDNFAYRVDVGVQVFLLAGVLALVIAWCTVGYQSIKATLANPVDRLRSE
jgi:putative ABC transport system permease protein